MNYFLYKIRFLTSVHFGPWDSAQSLYSSEDHFLADTLFSALCIEAKKRGGEQALEQFYRHAKHGQILLSDSMPWHQEKFYLPKPVYCGEFAEGTEQKDRKAFKKLKWISADCFDAFVETQTGHGVWDSTTIEEHFGVASEYTKAVVTEGKDTVPYQVGVYTFGEDCGLYFFAAFSEPEQNDQFRLLLEGLGLTGIGGKTSSGYGKFEIDDEIYLNEPFDDQTQWFYNALCGSNANRYMLLTSSLPTEQELPKVIAGASYQLTRRGGFAAGTERKKQTQYVLAAGSILDTPFEGDVYSVSASDQYPAFRYSKPLLLGVSL